MAPFRFVTLGIGNAFSALSYSSCLALNFEENWLLIDCPHPIRKMMREASLSSQVPVDVADISAVVLTHLHGDHVSGLEDFSYYCYYALKGRRAKILAHPEVSARLWQGHLAAAMEWSMHPGSQPVQRTFEHFFELQTLSETSSVPVGPFMVECHRTIHSMPTTAVRIHAGGRCLGYSADTAFDSSLIQWLSQADLIVHESGLGDVHTPYEKLAALPEELRARMRLIHYPDDFDRANSVIEPLLQGRCYEV